LMRSGYVYASGDFSRYRIAIIASVRKGPRT
jgi:hypothetical protein